MTEETPTGLRYRGMMFFDNYDERGATQSTLDTLLDQLALGVDHNGDPLTPDQESEVRDLVAVLAFDLAGTNNNIAALAA